MLRVTGESILKKKEIVYKNNTVDMNLELIFFKILKQGNFIWKMNKLQSLHYRAFINDGD